MASPDYQRGQSDALRQVAGELERFAKQLQAASAPPVAAPPPPRRSRVLAALKRLAHRWLP
jgi:hypothetical protein